MILDDFKTGGFPITLHTPVICTIKFQDPNNLVIIATKIVYNRCDLKTVIKKHHVIYLLGIWPGKKQTDGFPLNIKAYSDIPTPPEIHKEIDSAVEINITMNRDQFSKIVYKPGPRSENKTLIESKDIKLCEYVKLVGLKYKTSFG